MPGWSPLGQRWIKEAVLHAFSYANTMYAHGEAFKNPTTMTGVGPILAIGGEYIAELIGDARPEAKKITSIYQYVLGGAELAFAFWQLPFTKAVAMQLGVTPDTAHTIDTIIETVNGSNNLGVTLMILGTCYYDISDDAPIQMIRDRIAAPFRG